MKALYTLVLMAITAFSNLDQPSSNDSDLITIEQFHIVGISVRTSNHGEAVKDIEGLWGRFWGKDIRNKVPNKTSEDIYAVYTNYESDYNGAYTMIIGMPVSSLDNIPEGFEGITIAKAHYKKFVSKGKMPEAVVKTWMKIWQADKELNRAYKADFTVHGPKYFDGDNAEVETFISIKE